MEQVEASIERYLSALETADRQEGELAEAKSARLKDKIGALRERMRKYRLRSCCARRAGQADFVDRSGCAIDGDERQGHRHGRLQIVDKLTEQIDMCP